MKVLNRLIYRIKRYLGIKESFYYHQGKIFFFRPLKKPKYEDIQLVGYTIQYRQQNFKNFYNYTNRLYDTEEVALKAFHQIKNKSDNQTEFCLIPVYRIREDKIREVKIKKILDIN